MTEYCIDTSSLVEAANRRYPREMFPSIWEFIEKQVDAGFLYATELVRDEIERRDDALHGWAKQQPKLFVPIDEDIQKQMRTLLKEFPRAVASGKNKNMADPWVVCLAKIRGATVITEERGDSVKENPKIPLMGKFLGLEVINFLEWMKRHGLRFDLAKP